ncbi:MAG: RNA polymerase sigma factor, partial [Solirubrobacteraceae bacterium]
MHSAHIAAPPAQRARRPPSRLALAGDERLARLVTNGSERAFTTLYERHHQQLYRYCRSLLSNDSDAQDALQSTFTNALVALRRGPLGAPVRPWLFRIAHNESISLLRRRRPVEELSDALESQELSVEHAAHERERLALLVADLHQLSERQRGALVMRELSGLSYEEVALALGISVGTAKQTVLEARQSLQEFAEGREMACDEIQAVISSGDGRVLRRRRVRAHMRSCTNCSAFAAAIDTRRVDLLALSPMLPAAAAAGMLRQLVGGASGHGGGSGGLAAGSAGSAGKMAGAALSTKAIATTAALVATTAVGAVATLHATGAAGPVHRTAVTIRGAQAHGTQRVDPGTGSSSNGLPFGNESAHARALSLRGIGAIGSDGANGAVAGASPSGGGGGAAAVRGSSHGGAGALPAGTQASSGQPGS